MPLTGSRFLIDASVDEFMVLFFRKPGGDVTELHSPSGTRFGANNTSGEERWFARMRTM